MLNVPLTVLVPSTDLTLHVRANSGNRYDVRGRPTASASVWMSMLHRRRSARTRRNGTRNATDASISQNQKERDQQAAWFLETARKAVPMLSGKGIHAWVYPPAPIRFSRSSFDIIV